MIFQDQTPKVVQSNGETLFKAFIFDYAKVLIILNYVTTIFVIAGGKHESGQ